MTVTKEQAMQMFGHDLKILMSELRGMQAHYQIGDWEAFVFLRKPDCPESYVVEYAAADDGFAKQIVQLHAPAPTDSVVTDVANEILEYINRESGHSGDWFGFEDEKEIAAIIYKHFPTTPSPVPEPHRWCNNCGSKDIEQEFDTAEQFLDAYNKAAAPVPDTADNEGDGYGSRFGQYPTDEAAAAVDDDDD